MTKKNENKGHDQEVLDITHTHTHRQRETFCSGDEIQVERKTCVQIENEDVYVTFMPIHIIYILKDVPLEHDYFLMSDRWKNMVTSAKTKWIVTYHRFGSKYNHSLISFE